MQPRSLACRWPVPRGCRGRHASRPPLPGCDRPGRSDAARSVRRQRGAAPRRGRATAAAAAADAGRRQAGTSSAGAVRWHWPWLAACPATDPPSLPGSLRRQSGSCRCPTRRQLKRFRAPRTRQVQAVAQRAMSPAAPCSRLQQRRLAARPPLALRAPTIGVPPPACRPDPQAVPAGGGGGPAHTPAGGQLHRCPVSHAQTEERSGREPHHAGAQRAG